MVVFHAIYALPYVPYVLKGISMLSQMERSVSKQAATQGGMMRTARARNKKKHPAKTTIAGKKMTTGVAGWTRVKRSSTVDERIGGEALSNSWRSLPL